MRYAIGQETGKVWSPNGLTVSAGWFSLLTLLVFSMLSPRTGAAQSKQLGTGQALYARAVRLSHNAPSSLNGPIVASVTAFPGGNAEEDIYSSPDGSTFTQIGTVTDPGFAGGLCCGTLFELPTQVGALAPGTLLWAGAVGQSSTTAPMQLKIYTSTNQGQSWSYLSSCATGATIGSTSGGLWEPQFTIANDGALVCFYSDEQQPGHSQLIHQVRSYDGLSWQDSTFTVASGLQADRPGTPVVTKLSSGTYFLTFELCGPAACTVFYKTSPDGWNWGNASDVGSKVATASGQYFEHTPTVAWAPSAASSDGTILLVGQVMYESSGQVSPGNGITIFTNHTADGSGPWGTMAAPVKVPTAYDNYCPNYSSPLLPSVDGQTVLEFASSYSGSVCQMYYATGPILAGTLTPESVTVTPSSSSVTTAQGLSVSVTVQASTGGPTPTGTVTLTGPNGYSSNAATLSNGIATIQIAANALAAGSDVLTANYSGDGNYVGMTGTATVSVTQAIVTGFSISANNLTLSAGAGSQNAATITVTPSGGFTGVVTLTASILSGPAGSTLASPILVFDQTNPVTITGAASATANLKILSSASMASLRRQSHLSITEAVMPLGLLLILPACVRRRRARYVALFSCLGLAILMMGASGCGNGGFVTQAVSTGTTPGNYVISVTGNSGAYSSTGTFTLTVQ